MALQFAGEVYSHEFVTLQGHIQRMLQDMEEYILSGTGVPSPSLLVAVLDFADMSPEDVRPDLIRALNRIIGGSYHAQPDGGADVAANLRRARESLRTLYGRRRPRRQGAIPPVAALNELGLELDDKVAVPNPMSP